MDSVKPSAVSSKKSKLARTFAKVLHIRMLTGVLPVGEIQNQKVNQDKVKSVGDRSDSFDYSGDDDEEELQEKAAMEALLAKLFANIAVLKAAYAQLQYSQSPFDADGIQAADQTVVAELKSLSELKRCFLKKQFDPSPETAMLSAEIVEQKSVLKIYEISVKKLNSQVRLQDSEIIFLKEKLKEAKNGNRLLEKRLNQSGPLFMLENLQPSSLNSNHFARVFRYTVKSIRSFVQLLINGMTSASWDISAAASAIEPDVVYWKDEHKCFAFEAFVCRVMFESFNYPNFAIPNESLPDKQQQKKLYFGRFNELKSSKSKEYLARKPKSTFAKFCRVKYLQLIHPRMESSFFGNLSQGSLVISGKMPGTPFFATFSEMAWWVWLLHCLSFSFEPEASIFQANPGCRFSEVYMKSVIEEVFSLSMESDPQVAFTVIPGFNIGKTVIQSQVYLSQSTKHNVKPVQRKQR